MALVAALLPASAPFAALAADAGTDAGADTDVDTDTDLCDGACEELFYNACACGLDDPCGWAGDGVCDEACLVSGWVEAMFDDSADCDPAMDGGVDSDTDSASDTTTDTAADAGLDASTSGLSTSGCTCAHAGAAVTTSLLRLLIDPV
jgi:hypothetical protein